VSRRWLPSYRQPIKVDFHRWLSTWADIDALHDIYNRGGDIDRALRAIINEAVTTKALLVEIIPG